MRRVSLKPRENWQAKAEALGFDWHTADGVPYWNESAAYVFSLKQIEDDLEAPSAEIEAMCLEFAGRAVKDESILKRLAVPEPFWQPIADSWNSGQRNLYGRFDLAYDGRSPAKLLEYNADTPTSLFEAAVVQWLWLEQQIEAGALPKGADQFNSLHERLIDGFKGIRRGEPYHLHLACAADSAEDLGTIKYLEDCAKQAGCGTTILTMPEIGLGRDGRFADQQDIVIETLFKLYPYEWMFREEFGKAIAASGTQFIEPMWKAVLSNKGLLPYLWEMAPGHSNLLPAFFHDDRQAGSVGMNYVKKPLYSREGSNVTLMSGSTEIAQAGGPYGAEGHIVQQAVTMPNLGGGYFVMGCWVVASQPAGLGIREDDTPVTRNTSRFVPHYIDG